MENLNLNTKGYYDGSYEIKSEIYSGVDFSKYCFIFQGQGGVTPRMAFDLYNQYDEIKNKFVIANEIVKEFNLGEISDYITNPDNIPQESLHIYGNIALFILQTAMFDILIKSGIKPKTMTSHSFGEYAMLTNAGIVSFENMLKIVCNRELLSAKPNELGYLVAINLPVKELENFIINNKIDIYISNINSHTQTVASVAKNNLEKVEDILNKENINYTILYSVPQPYHSPMMNETRNKFSKYVRGLDFEINEPVIDIISSVTGEIINKNNFTKEGIYHILENQLTSPVNFVKQINSAYDNGNYHFIEVGVKNIFSKMLSGILVDKEYKTQFVNDLIKKQEHLIKSNKKHNKTIVNAINKVIGKVTGYNIVDIKLEDRFQEDIGIDSIKKANIVFQVLDKMNIKSEDAMATSDILTVEDIVDYVENYDRSKINKVKVEKNVKWGRYNLVEKEKLFSSLVSENAYISTDFLYLNVEDFLTEKSEQVFEMDGSKKVIVFKLNSKLAYNDYLKFIFSIKKLISKIESSRIQSIILCSFEYESGIVLASFLKSIKRELNQIYFKHIYIENGDKYSFEKINNILSLEINNDVDIDVLYRGNSRFVFDTVKPKISNDNISIDSESVIVATGGASGATYSILQNISDEYKCKIHILGRREYDNVKDGVEKLKKNNPGNIFYYSVDVLDNEKLENVFSEIYKINNRIDYVMHGAGILDINFLKNKKEEVIESEFEIKAKACIKLLELAGKHKIKKVIAFSSTLSTYGSAGQSVYSTANTFMNTLKSNNSLFTVVNWPAWDQVGMTEDLGVLKKLKEYGVPLINKDIAYNLFKFDFLSTSSDVVYYMDEYDNNSMSFMLNNYNKYSNLIGKINDESALSSNSIIFERNFDISKDMFLNDHKINNTIILPGSYLASSAFCLSYLYFKKFRVLNDIKLLSIVNIDPTNKIKLSNELTENKMYFNVSTSTNNFSSFVYLNESEDNLFSQTYVEELFDLGNSNNTGNYSLFSNDVYKDYFDKSEMVYGPLLRVLSEIYKDNSNNINALIDSKKLKIFLGLDILDSMVILLDVGFQLFGALKLKDERKVLPHSVSKLIYFEEEKLYGDLEIIIRNVKIDDDGVSGDVAILNDNKKIVIAMLGVRLMNIKS